MKSIFKIFIAIISLSVTISSCKKEEVKTDIVPKLTQSVKFHIHNTVGNEALVYGKSYKDNASIAFNVSIFQYYISNIKFIKTDGTEVESSVKALLVKPTTSEYNLGELPIGNYNGITFLVGVDSTTNHSDPTVHDASNPLAIQTPSMHWNWNSGYIFMKFEGNSDTTITQAGPLNLPLLYHLGMDKYVSKIDLSNNPFTVTSEFEKELVLQLDLKTIFNGLNVKKETITHTMDNMMIANKLHANIGKAFSIVK